jgi:hypothetical protein
MLLLVSIQNTVVIYRIIYMAFYLFFILSFQVRKGCLSKVMKENLCLKISFGFWRKTASTFHLTIIIYSMIILIGLYVYQVMFTIIFYKTNLYVLVRKSECIFNK